VTEGGNLAINPANTSDMITKFPVGSYFTVSAVGGNSHQNLTPDTVYTVVGWGDANYQASGWKIMYYSPYDYFPDGGSTITFTKNFTRTPAPTPTPTPIPDLTPIQLPSPALNLTSVNTFIKDTGYFNKPTDIAFDSNRNMYIVDSGYHCIKKFSQNGRNITMFAGNAGVPGSSDGTGTAATFNTPIGIAIDTNNNLYVTDQTSTQSGGMIRKITPDGVVTTIKTGLRYPYGIALDNGSIWITLYKGHGVQQIKNDGTSIMYGSTTGKSGTTDGTSTQAKFNYPAHIAIYSGSIYIADSGSNTIRKITNGSVSTFASSNSTTIKTNFKGAKGIAADSSSNIYVADTANHTIQMITPSGVVTQIAGVNAMSGYYDSTNTLAKFYSPDNIVLNNGKIYVVDTYNNAIRTII